MLFLINIFGSNVCLGLSAKAQTFFKADLEQIVLVSELVLHFFIPIVLVIVFQFQ